MRADKNNTIKREARDKVKGFRFQKLRAVELLIDTFSRHDNPWVYCAIENIGDVRFHEGAEDNTKDHIEEDKDYNNTISFSLNSPQVLNSLVAFVDTWITFEFSETFHFVFCTTANIAKENYTKRIKALGITLPSVAILECLRNHQYDPKFLIDTVKALVIDEYRMQYSAKNKKGFLSVLQGWNINDWQAFLRCIGWNFGHCDEKQLEEELITKLKESTLYNERLYGKESQLISLLVDLFDKKQNQKIFSDRFISGSDVKLLSIQVEAGEYQIPDQAWKIWDSLDVPQDKRNIIDKSKSVVANFDQIVLENWSRKVAMSRIQQNDLKHDRSIFSLKYRIYDRCQIELINMVKNADKTNITSSTIEEWVTLLTDCALEHINDLKKDHYYYPLQSRDAIKGIILELVDSCFLSFDYNDGVN